MGGLRARMRWAAPLVAMLCLVLAGGADARQGGASLSARLVPEHPEPGSTARLVIEGQTTETAMAVVVASGAQTCPKRITGEPVLVPKDGLGTGGVGAHLTVHVTATTTRYCAYLVPAEQDAYGKTTYDVHAAPLARAEAPVAPALRLERGVSIFGHTAGGTSTVALVGDRSGTRITRIIVTCGGNPLHPPALGRAFIGKRFTAKVALPVARTIRWSGAVTPDNSSNYDKPIPARWTGPVRYVLNVRLVFVDGQPELVTGRGALTGGALPCPKTRLYVRS
jgi:hypothetical protein